ncbi:MAG TPA: exosortase/archaeosortase family protein [Candidatus Limnocylindrales bacterium]|nr:exosortase/archaeosortase family protein [Candidatus Limnocylindrales bacterium]
MFLLSEHNIEGRVVSRTTAEMPQASRSLALRPLLTAVPLAILWWTLINHLRIEWSINPQYGYGWAVPWLGLYLAWRRLRTTPTSSGLCPLFPVVRPLFAVLCLLWLPTRLLQEANPEWRLVSWALALQVVALSLFILRKWSRRILFPLLFMLVAVPWPSVIEQPVIQRLSYLTAQIASETLNLVGLPAVQQGNLVELGLGTIGIEEACSGIRSFQAALMVSLFFCGFYQFNGRVGMKLVGTGFILAIVLNAARITLLAIVAATKGMNAVAAWHDIAGLLIPIACFLLVALVARCFADARSEHREQENDGKGQRTMDRVQKSDVSTLCDLRPPTSDLCPLGSNLGSLTPALSLTLCLMAAEAATELWYRAHEATLPPPITWSIAPPREDAAIVEKPLAPRAKQLLRFDETLNASWEESGGRTWQAIFLRWKPGRVAGRLAKDHTPAICLSAVGRDLLAPVQEELVWLPGLQLHALIYSASDPIQGKVHILFCLQEERGAGEFDLKPSSLWEERLAPVLAGRRNSGLRSLELAVWGIQDDEEAKKALLAETRNIIRVDVQKR